MADLVEALYSKTGDERFDKAWHSLLDSRQVE
jgi:hypothetical protein